MGRPRLDGRNGEVWERVAIYGWNYEKAADHFGVSLQRIAQIVADVRANLGPIMTEELVQHSKETILDLKARALEVAEKAKRGAPVAVGKDGSTQYETLDDGTEVAVRDYGGYLKALETVAKLDEQLARRFGINAPEKKEITLTGTVRYEISGVDPEADLT